MATKRVKVCDRCGAHGATTMVVLIGTRPKREDLCSAASCGGPLMAEWDRMASPRERRSTRRLTVVPMEEVLEARRVARTQRGKP